MIEHMPFQTTIRFALTCMLLALSVFFIGCASFGERNLRVRSEFEQGRLDEARSEIEKSLKKRHQKEADLLKLNQAIIELSSGRPKESEKLLREVRDSFEKLEQKRLGESAVSMLTDDNAVSYSGEDYEKVLIRVFLALSNLMYDGTDAPAYALQIGRKQNEIIKKGAVKDPAGDGKTINLKESYRQVAIGSYLVGAMREETARDYDDAVKAYEAVCAWEPDFSQGRRDLQRARHGVHSRPGHGVVYVIGLVGAGPYKLQRNCEVLQAAQFWTTAIMSMTSSSTMIPDFSPVMVPVIVRPRETVCSLHVSIDGKTAGRTETLTDIGRMAEEQFEAVYPQIIARAVVRRLLKKGIVYGAKDALDANPWVSLAMELGGILWQSTETADTRCWNLLPAEIQIVRLEVPTGDHTLSLQPETRVFSLSRKAYLSTEDSVPTGSNHSRTIRVDAGRNTYVLANFPGKNLVGDIVVSNEGRFGDGPRAENGLAP